VRFATHTERNREQRGTVAIHKDCFRATQVKEEIPTLESATDDINTRDLSGKKNDRSRWCLRQLLEK